VIEQQHVGRFGAGLRLLQRLRVQPVLGQAGQRVAEVLDPHASVHQLDERLPDKETHTRHAHDVGATSSPQRSDVLGELLHRAVVFDDADSKQQGADTVDGKVQLVAAFRQLTEQLGGGSSGGGGDVKERHRLIRGEPQLTGIGLKWEWAQGGLELVAKS